MPWTSDHLSWLVNTNKTLKTSCGKEVQIWELQHKPDAKILSAWAKHFRNHYCLDTGIDKLRVPRSRKDYLNDIKFPSNSTNLGPATRAGDFGEILVADYVQWILKFWVPRVRWGAKVSRDESPKGSDVIGFKFFKQGTISTKDILAVFESKTKFSPSRVNRLQDAVNDSAKDHLRIDESLNYIKQRLLEQGKDDEATLVERFQDPIDSPYQELYGAAALISEDCFDASEIGSVDSNKVPKNGKHIPHPQQDKLVLLIVKGVDMMNLVHELYRRAADEA
jgi:hypothetical protein